MLVMFNRPIVNHNFEYRNRKRERVEKVLYYLGILLILLGLVSLNPLIGCTGLLFWGLRYIIRYIEMKEQKHEKTNTIFLGALILCIIPIFLIVLDLFLNK